MSRIGVSRSKVVHGKVGMESTLFLGKYRGVYSTVLYPASYLGTVLYLDHYIQYSATVQYSTSATVAVPGYPGIQSRYRKKNRNRTVHSSLSALFYTR